MQENLDELQLNFRHKINGEPVITAITQDYITSEVLMVAHMNRSALQKSLQTRKAHYWSTSRNKIWLKGESSGHLQIIKEILIDCDEDAVLIKVKQLGGACHKGYYSCFFRKISDENGYKLKIIKDKVFDVDKIYGENR